MPLTRRVSYREAWLDLSSGILLCGVYESPISPARGGIRGERPLFVKDTSEGHIRRLV